MNSKATGITGLPAWGVKMGGIIILLLFAVASFAQTIPDRPNPPKLVNDMAGLMNGDQIYDLETKLDAYNDSTSTQIVIVTINNLDGGEIADYATKIGDKWGVGRKNKDNGVVILVSKEDRKAFIATGKGIEGALPDAYCRRIVDNIMVPYFKQQLYYSGLDGATAAIMKLAAGEFVNDVSKEKKSFPVLPIIIIVFVVLFILSRMGRNGGGGGGISSAGWFAGSLLSGGGGGGFSGGGGGGGFGGFGGGSFGGGGAGGSW